MKKRGLIGIAVVMCLVLGTALFFPHAVYARKEGAYWRVTCRDQQCAIRHVLYSKEQGDSIFLNYNPDLMKDGIRFVNAETTRYAPQRWWKLEKVSGNVYLIILDKDAVSKTDQKDAVLKASQEDWVLTYQFYGGTYHYGCLKKREGSRGSSAQRWRLIPVDVDNDIYMLENVELSRVQNASRVLHIASASPNWKTIMGTDK